MALVALMTNDFKLEVNYWINLNSVRENIYKRLYKNEIFILHKLNMLDNIASSMLIKNTEPSLKLQKVLS